MSLTQIWYRIYSDYFLASRMKEYAALLDLALKNGYLVTSVIDYYDKVQQHCDGDFPKILICRHDIDTDALTARVFFEIERARDIKSSFYFRLSTLDYALMHEIHAYGSEASYHYEEIAAFCKRNRMREAQKVWDLMPEIQNEFVSNYQQVKMNSRLPLRSVASHGDFVNRALDIANTALLTQDVRSLCGIEVEAYDAIIKGKAVNVSDRMHPRFWIPDSPENFIKNGNPIIHLLTHPRHWRASWRENTKDNLRRLWEGLSYHRI